MSRYRTPGESRKAGIAYHMVPEEEWEQKRDAALYTPAAFEAEGFIHCTNGIDELVAVGNRYYSNDTRPYLALVLDVQSIVSPVRYDDPQQVYPHVFGPLNLSAVIGILRAERDRDGTFRDFV